MNQKCELRLQTTGIMRTGKCELLGQKEDCRYLRHTEAAHALCLYNTQNDTCMFTAIQGASKNVQKLQFLRNGLLFQCLSSATVQDVACTLFENNFSVVLRTDLFLFYRFIRFTTQNEFNIVTLLRKLI